MINIYRWSIIETQFSYLILTQSTSANSILQSTNKIVNIYRPNDIVINHWWNVNQIKLVNIGIAIIIASGLKLTHLRDAISVTHITTLRRSSPIPNCKLKKVIKK